MALTAYHTAGPVLIGASSWIDQIQSQSFSPGIEAIVDGGSGSIEALFAASGMIVPAASFQTTAIATALGVIGVSGLALNGTTATLSLHYTQKAQGGTRAGALSHKKIAIARGLVVPTSLSADQSGASISYEAVGYSSDGTTAPAAITESVTIGTTPGVTEHFVAGPVKLNGSTIVGVMEININFGISLEPKASSGEVYPTFVCVRDRVTSITIRTGDMSVLTASMLTGFITSGDNFIYLRKVASGGTRVTDVTASHCIFTVQDAACYVRGGVSSVTHNGDAMAEIIMQPIFDGTNAPITFATGAIA